MSEQPTETPPPGDSPPPGGGGVSPESRQWGMFAHLAALAGFVIPFGNLIGPLIIWQVKKDEMPFVADQGKESLNFQITVTIAAIVCVVLMVVLIGALLLPLVGLAALVFVVIAAVKANQGEAYRYPVTLRLIK